MSEQEMFENYERVRKSGVYNMIMQANEAATDAGLTMDQYMFVINNYSDLYRKYGKE